MAWFINWDTTLSFIKFSQTIKISPQLKLIGYTSSNSLKTLSTLALVVITIIIRIALIILSFIFCPFFQADVTDYLGDGLQESILDLTTEAYMEFLITLFLQSEQFIPPEWTNGEIIGTAISVFCFIALIVFSVEVIRYQCTG